MAPLHPSDIVTLREQALAVPANRLGIGSPIRLTVVPDYPTLLDGLAATMLDAYRAGLREGREHVVFIVPVGPTGQYERLARLCNAERQDLSRLVLINMDEYLLPDGDAMPPTHKLSFRGHIQRQLWDRLAPGLAPPPTQHLVPDPRDPAAIGRAIAQYGGVDWCFAGVGVTGHLAFNDPPEPGETDDPAAFADLPTRIVTLSRETVVVNAMNALRGNVHHMPRRAVSVGMREILASRRIRVYLHRPYSAAAIRLLLHGPITATMPASLLQAHPDVAAVVTDEVTLLPEA